MLNGYPHHVAGVLPAGFRFPRPDLLSGIGGSTMKVDLFKPIAFDRAKLPADGSYNYIVLGRLRPNVAVHQALAELNTVQAALTKEFGKDGLDLRAEMSELQERIVAGSRRGLLLLLAAIGAVLLIMCVNLGNLLLARATSQWREMAVRVALGAGSWRIMRQVLTESVVLALAGGDR